MTKKNEWVTATTFGMQVNGNTRVERVLREALKLQCKWRYVHRVQSAVNSALFVSLPQKRSTFG